MEIYLTWRSTVGLISCTQEDTKSAKLDFNLRMDVLLQNKLQWGSLGSFLSDNRSPSKYISLLVDSIFQKNIYFDKQFSI